jgi:hypothetical protein
VGFAPAGAGGAALPCADDGGTAQIALVTRVAGRLRQAAGSSRGGFFDLLEMFHAWSEDTVIGEITPEPGVSAPAGEPLRLLTMNARRPSGLAEGRSGLLTGWADRTRACRADGPGPVTSLLSLGICEMVGVLRGERFAFLEILEEIRGPAQVIYTSDDTVVHTAEVILDQLRRTDADREAIARDLAETLPAVPVVPAPRDWIFAGAFLNALNHSPMDDRYDVLARDGVRRAGPAEVILLSLGAEGQTVLRHKRLGYSAYIHGFRLRDAGQAFNTWVRANFEPVRKTLDDIRADYERLVDAIQARRPGTHILICNRMSSSGQDDLQSYAAFDEPLSETLASVRDKEANLMLTDLAREKGVAIIDADAIAAELGGQRSLPDGVHQNGAMQAAVRAEVLRTLRARGVPGFEAPA